MYGERSLTKTVYGALVPERMNETSPIAGIIDATSFYLGCLLPIINEGKPGDKVSRSGALVVARRGQDKPIPLMVVPIGGITPKYLDYVNWAMGKIQTLQDHPEHASSWFSRNAEDGPWGGGICTGDYLISFSGLEELEDEVLMVLVALLLNLITEEEAIEKIMRPSGSLAIYEKFKTAQQ